MEMMDLMNDTNFKIHAYKLSYDYG